MLFQIDTTLARFVKFCPHKNDWHDFPKYPLQIISTHNSNHLNEQIQDVFTTHFFENKHDHRQRSFSTFFYMNWFSMLFQIDFFKKVIVTILLCFVTSCHHENYCQVFKECLFQKTEKLKSHTGQDSRCFYNLEIFFNLFYRMIFQIDFFRKIIVTTLSCLVTSCPHKNDWHVFPKGIFQKNLNHKLSNR